MRKHISLQLIVGFTGIAVITVLIIGSLFIGLYQRTALDAKRDDMLFRARNLSPLVAEYLTEGSAMRGMGGFFRFMDAINDANMWVLDAEGNVVALPGKGLPMGFGRMSGNLHMAEAAALPAEAADSIQILLTGQETVDESFSNLYGEATLSVGVPVFSQDNTLLGGVLLHAPVTAVTEGLRRAYGILLAGLVAGLVVAILLGIGYSVVFTQPLKQMNHIARAMTAGDYKVRTELKRLDEFGQLGDAMDHLAISLDHAAQESDKLEQMRRDFIANVSHEFRTPLTIIRGSAEAVLDETDSNPADRMHRMQAILAETSSMNRLVGDLLELSRLESGHIALEMEPVWIQQVMEDIWRGLSPITEKKDLTLECLLLEDLPPILADYGRFRQLLLIFLDNAVKHAPRGSVLKVSARASDGFIHLDVQDQGLGIPPEELSHVWERFYTLDKARSGRGTGLGLPIARQLASLMNGTVSLSSNTGEGTIAHCTLPQASVSNLEQ